MRPSLPTCAVRRANSLDKGSAKRLGSKARWMAAGASILAIGAVVPTGAQAAAGPGIEHANTSTNVADTLTICLVDEHCEFGASQTAPAAAQAAVSDVASGQIRQVGTATGTLGTVDLVMDNDGTASIAALAHATGPATFAYATASLTNAIFQAGMGAGNVAADLDNDGELAIEALATANGQIAKANAAVRTAIAQNAISTESGSASVVLGNSGDLAIEAVASAIETSTRGGSQIAFASISGAIFQTAIANDGLASVELDNQGSLTFSASAFAGAAEPGAAAGTYASAVAVMNGALYQNVFGGDDVSASLSNSGDLTAVVAAEASNAAGVAYASAAANGVFVQLGQAVGDVTLDVTNGGDLTIAAQADAMGQYATALAIIEQGLVQNGAATASGDVAIAIANSGNLLIGASAEVEGQAVNAVAYIDGGLIQFGNAYGSGDVSLSLANSGDLAIDAFASASGDTSAWSLALIKNAILQQGVASDGVGTAELDNDGSIQIMAQAVAHADSGSVAASQSATALMYGARVTATAVVSAAIVQDVQGEDGADASLTNSGDISIVASAEATAAGSALELSPVAVAAAQDVIYQVSRSTGGDASIELDNDGDLTILSVAEASSDSGAELALAIVSSAIHQEANASGDVSVSLTNSGDLGIGAQAEAAGPVASAIAVVFTAIHQNAFATGEGDAAASLQNDGSLQISAVASATGSNGDGSQAGYGRALAINGGGIVLVAQNGIGAGDMDVSLDNSDTIDIVAVAHAEAGGVAAPVYGRSTPVGASATAIVTAAVVQGAIGEHNSTVSLNNSGELTVAAVADASGPEMAETIGLGASSSAGYFAGASMSGGILQVAFGENADVSLANEGSLEFLALANAESHDFGEAKAIVGLFAAVTQYAGGNGGDANILFGNDGSMTLAAQAHAEADGDGVAAAAGQLFGEIVQTVVGDGNLTATLANSGTIEMGVNAVALADANAAYANALAGQIVRQSALFAGTATATVGDGQLVIDNSGSFLVGADALASGQSGAANATIGTGLSQFNLSHGDAINAINNSGALEIHTAAEAHGTRGPINAVSGIAAAIRQRSLAAENADVSIDNEGDLSIVAAASAAGSADGVLLGEADVIARLGAATFLGFVGVIDQSAFGNEASANLSNSGSLQLIADASGSGATADVNARIMVGVEQRLTAFTGDAQAVLDNGGDLAMVAAADANAADGGATAVAEIGNGIEQWVNAVNGDAIASIDNSGAIEIASISTATSNGKSLANSTARGFTQAAQNIGPRDAEGEGTASFTNSGDVLVHAGASAQGGSAVSDPGGPKPIPVPLPLGGGGSAPAADAFANALGLGQMAANLEVANSGSMIVQADAEAAGPLAAHATALAEGMRLMPLDYADAAANIDVANSGDFAVFANAAAEGASGWAYAQAVGMSVFGAATGTVSGSITNSGNFIVEANAEMAGIGSGIASAIGMDINAGSADLSIDNSGVLMVSASSTGGSASATAIRLSDYGMGGAGNVALTNDGGVIIARQSTDGGETWTRGTAIDTRYAPGASVINLVGNGSIYGNVELASGDTINVTGGETSFNGIIKTDCARGPCAPSILNIGGGGSLFLRHASAADAQTAINVGEFNMAADGTIIFELPTDLDARTGFAPVGSYAQIFADVANLDGTLLIRSASGLYGDSFLFEDIIDANEVNGQFDHCGIDGDPALLSLSCVYDTAGNVDLQFTRIAFDEVGGLSRNQKSVGGAIEDVYDVNLGGDFGDMVGQLFTFDAEDYRHALNQLSGSGHAAYLQSFHNLGVQQADLIDRAIGCELPDQQASSLSCRTDKVSLWGQLDFGSRGNDGDEEAGAYDADRWMAAIGVDAEVGQDLVAGLSLTKVSNSLDFHDGGRWKADGYQLGAYGVLDRGAFYAKAMASMGWFNGSSERRIDWSDLGGDIVGSLAGKPDARLWTLGARFGYRVPLGERSQLTPYLNIDYSHTTLKGFTETGLDAAALDVETSTSSRTAVTLGAKWAGDVGGIVPQFELGYRRLFGDTRAAVDASFDAMSGTDFTTVSSVEKRGSVLAGASIGGKVGKVDVRVGYTGLFDGQSTSHNANFRLTLPLGKK